MKKTYLTLSVLGFILPNIFVMQETFTSGNILLWTDLLTTFKTAFANNISSAFMTDLVFVLLVFFIWTFVESKNIRKPKLYTLWIATVLFGLAGGFPLYLYLKLSDSKMKN